MVEQKAHFHFVSSNEAKCILSEKMYWDNIAKDGFEVFTDSDYSGFYAIDFNRNGEVDIKDDLNNDIFLAPSTYGSPLDIAEKIETIEWNHYGYLWFDTADDIKDQIFGKASDLSATAAMAVGITGIIAGGMAVPLYVVMAVSMIGGGVSLTSGMTLKRFGPITEYVRVILYDDKF